MARFVFPLAGPAAVSAQPQPEKRRPGRPRKYPIRVDLPRHRRVRREERIPQYRLDELPDYLTVEEAADVLRCAPMTVYRWINGGKLPAAKFGGLWLIRKQDLGARPRTQGGGE
jgi:excisionase family DNA binding protein